jgi:CRP/FNR family transcriptional regulator
MVPVEQTPCRLCQHCEKSVFAELSDPCLDSFCDLRLVQSYRKGQRIFYEGEPNLSVAVLCSGRALLSRSNELGKRQILRLVKPCSLLEEKDLFLNDRRTATAEAIEDSVVCFVKRPAFLEFMQRNPTIAARVGEQLARALDQAQAKIESFTGMDVRQRIANLLLRLAHEHGRPAAGGRRIDVVLTREQLAEMAGTTVETAIRVLSALRRDGVITQADRHIVLADEPRLRRLAGADPT